jgi:hypothetical protein
MHMLNGNSFDWASPDHGKRTRVYDNELLEVHLAYVWVNVGKSSSTLEIGVEAKMAPLPYACSDRIAAMGCHHQWEKYRSERRPSYVDENRRERKAI